MHHFIHSGQRPAYRIRIPNVGLNELHSPVKLAGKRAGRVYLIDQTVQHPHMIAAVEQGTGKMPTNKAGAAGDQNSLGQSTISFAQPAAWPSMPDRTSFY